LEAASIKSSMVSSSENDFADDFAALSIERDPPTRSPPPLPPPPLEDIVDDFATLKEDLAALIKEEPQEAVAPVVAAPGMPESVPGVDKPLRVSVKCGDVKLKLTLCAELQQRSLREAVIDPFLSAYNARTKSHLDATRVRAVKVNGSTIDWATAVAGVVLTGSDPRVVLLVRQHGRSAKSSKSAVAAAAGAGGGVPGSNDAITQAVAASGGDPAQLASLMKGVEHMLPPHLRKLAAKTSIEQLTAGLGVPAAQNSKAAAKPRPLGSKASSPPPFSAEASQIELSTAEDATLRHLIAENTRPCHEPAPTGPLAPARLSLDLQHPLSSGSQGGWVLVNEEPPVWTCDGFLSERECDDLIRAGAPRLEGSKIGLDDAQPSRNTGAKRSSSSCTLWNQSAVCEALIRKACALTRKTVHHFEPVQVCRYQVGEEYSEHQDSIPIHTRSDDGAAFMAQGGQRVATILVYLNSVDQGGETAFPKLGYACRPRKGRCLLFCPGLRDGRRDESTAHAARPAVDEKWVAQLWVREHMDPLWSLDPPRMPRGCQSWLDIYRSFGSPL
jgi:prolyl 4-hydroxylase